MAFDSMFTGISGLNAYQSWIDMISNNIANTETTGFKGQRMTFADMFYQQTGAASGPTTSSGGVNPQEEGLGVKVNTVDTEWAQGGLETTGINTDLAINGDGFFILNNANGSAAPTYTRDGAFSLNSNGLLYDPASGLAVQGYMANSAGQITSTGTPSSITIPIGQEEQATATGAGTKVGPSGDDVYDVAMGGNLDQTQWSQQFLDQIGASGTAGTPIVTQTTMYDSLGNAHLATITYTPDATGATAATDTPPGAGTNPANVTLASGQQLVNGAITVAPDTSQADQITVTVNGTGTGATVTDSLGNSVTATPGQQVTIGGATFTVGTYAAADAGATTQLTVNPASNGLPASVTSTSGQAEAPATRWSVSVSFSDGTTLSTIQTPGSISATGVVTAPTYTTASSGTIGYVYFNQDGDFINSSSIENTNGQALGASAADYLHSVGGTGPSIAQGNQLNIVSWGPSAGNSASAPTAGPAATPGPIAIDYYDNSSLAASSTTGSSTSGSQALSVLSQNGYAAGTLDNITVSANGDVVGAFTNGQNVTLAQVAVATFQNEDGLERIGSNQFAQTAASGLAQVGSAGSGTLGSIVAGSLEQSNVSLSTEFTNLILAQRAFEANTRGITTADQNLQTIIGLRASEN